MAKVPPINRKYYPLASLVSLLALALVLAVLTPRLFGGRQAEHDKATTQKFAATARGYAESESEISLRSLVAGIIREMNVRTGDRIRPGQVLVIFDRDKIGETIRSAESAVLEAHAQLEEILNGARSEDVEIAESREAQAKAVHEHAAADFERLKRLYLSKAIPFADLERAEERLKIANQELSQARSQVMRLKRGSRDEEIQRARASLDRANAELRYQRQIARDFIITSPIDGVVLKAHRDVHEAVSAGDEVLTVIDPVRLRIRAELEESDVGKVQVGQSAEVTTDALRGKVYTGRVSMVLPAVKKKTIKPFDPTAAHDVNTQEVHVALDDFAGITHGMTVTVRFLK